jgi:glutaconyl-CoA/methylmalonyl-CoA decarboxylase subunit gamma
MKSYKISVNGQSYDVTVEEVGSAASSARPAPAASPPPAPRPAAPAAPSPAGASSGGASSGGGRAVKAPMPGTLLSFKVAEGQAVKRGEVLLILEAMKMENEIVSPADGIVSLKASEGASVNTGDLLAELS